MTTGGEGGMVTTDDGDLWSRMWSFKDHGKSWEAVYEREHAAGVPLAARELRHQLADDGDAGGDRAHPVAAHG